MSTSSFCYIYQGGEVTRTDDLLPCGVTNETNPRVPCCWKGDTCLSDGICIYDHSLPGGSGYVAAGCTDEGFGEGCRSLCTNNAFGDIVYDPTSKAWHCCTYPVGQPLNCSNPSEEKFLAPATQDLLTIQFLPKTGLPTYITGAASSATATSLSPSTTVSSSSTPSSASPSNSHGLSSGAAAGVGVGTTVGVLALISLVGYLIYKRRQGRRHRANAPYPSEPRTPATFPNYEYRQPSELETPPKQMAPVEMGTTVTK